MTRPETAKSQTRHAAAVSSQRPGVSDRAFLTATNLEATKAFFFALRIQFKGMLVIRRFAKVSSLFSVPVLAAFFASLVLNAFELPLTPAAIHEAYILGRRNDQATAEFLNPYIRQLTAGTQRPDIAQIELLTPFAQVVDLSRRNATTNYTEEQAMEDYRRYGDKIVVQITLVLPTAYATARQNSEEGNPTEQKTEDASLRAENFWQNFRFSLKQHDKVIPSRAVHNKPIYSMPTKDTPSVLDGATVGLEYDAKDVAAEPATIEVLTPEPKTITATFDLGKLR